MAMDRRWVRIGHFDLRGDPGTGVIHLSISSVVVLPCTPILLLLAHRYTILWTDKRSAPCLQSIVGACGLKSDVPSIGSCSV